MPKKKIHVSLPGPVLDALKAIAHVEGRDVSDILDELTRNELKRRNLLPEPSVEDILAAMQRLHKRDRPKDG